MKIQGNRIDDSSLLNLSHQKLNDAERISELISPEKKRDIDKILSNFPTLVGKAKFPQTTFTSAHKALEYIQTFCNRESNKKLFPQEYEQHTDLMKRFVIALSKYINPSRTISLLDRGDISEELSHGLNDLLGLSTGVVALTKEDSAHSKVKKEPAFFDEILVWDLSGSQIHNPVLIGATVGGENIKKEIPTIVSECIENSDITINGVKKNIFKYLHDSRRDHGILDNQAGKLVDIGIVIDESNITYQEGQKGEIKASKIGISGNFTKGTIEELYFALITALQKNEELYNRNQNGEWQRLYFKEYFLENLKSKQKEYNLPDALIVRIENNIVNGSAIDVIEFRAILENLVRHMYEKYCSLIVVE